jgi:hypothetical protein
MAPSGLLVTFGPEDSEGERLLHGRKGVRVPGATQTLAEK